MVNHPNRNKPIVVALTNAEAHELRKVLHWQMSHTSSNQSANLCAAILRKLAIRSPATTNPGD